MQVREQRRIETVDDIIRLNIIDFSRCNGYWHDNPARAVNAIAPWLIGQFYTLVEYDMRTSPARDDFPVWYHTGDHTPLGRLFWNFFHDGFTGELIFHDAPDFSGRVDLDGHCINFSGDIGQVSASTFALDVLPHVTKGDLWITVKGEHTHLIIEFMNDIGKQITGAIVKRIGVCHT